MKPQRLRADALAGLTTAFALLPECIAFALVAQLNPLMGLYGAFIICTLTALLGGRPGMISGAAGSMAVVIVAVTGITVFTDLATAVLCGIIIAALNFAWQQARELYADAHLEATAASFIACMAPCSLPRRRPFSISSIRPTIPPR